MGATSRIPRNPNTLSELRRAFQLLTTAPVLARTLVDAHPHLFVIDSDDDLQFVLRVVATADLPAAGAGMNGQVLIETTGAAHNIVFYAGGLRYRIAGAAF